MKTARWPRPLNRGLISHSFLQLFWDFDYWPLNRGWPLNDDSTVFLSVVRTFCCWAYNVNYRTNE